MRYYQKQKPSQNNKSGLINAGLALVTVFALTFAYGQHEDAGMEHYAAANNCTWTQTGSYYGDSRDQVCRGNQ